MPLGCEAIFHFIRFNNHFHSYVRILAAASCFPNLAIIAEISVLLRFFILFSKISGSPSSARFSRWKHCARFMNQQTINIVWKCKTLNFRLLIKMGENRKCQKRMKNKNRTRNTIEPNNSRIKWN